MAPIDWVTGLFGAALIGFLWLPWYRSAGASRTAVSAWQAFAVNDIAFLVAGLTAIWLVVATATHSTGAVPIVSAAFTAWLAALATLLAAIRLIFPPDLGPGPTSRGAGIWLGAAAATGLAVSAWLVMRDERRGDAGSVALPPPMAAPRATEQGRGT